MRRMPKKISQKLIMITCTSTEIRWTGWFQHNSLTPSTPILHFLLSFYAHPHLPFEANVQFRYIFSLMRSVSNFRICSSLHISFFLLASFQFQLCAIGVGICRCRRPWLLKSIFAFLCVFCQSEKCFRVNNCHRDNAFTDIVECISTNSLQRREQERMSREKN